MAEEEEGPIMALRRKIYSDIFLRASNDKVCKDIITDPNFNPINNQLPYIRYLFFSCRSILFKYITHVLRENNIPFEVERVLTPNTRRINTAIGKYTYIITINELSQELSQE